MKRLGIFIVLYSAALFIPANISAQPRQTPENIMEPLYPADLALEEEVARKRGETDEQFFDKTMALFQEKKYDDESIAHCLKALELNPDDYEANTIAGMNYAKKGDFKRAVAYYQKATNIYPKQELDIAFMGFFSPDDENYRKNFYKAIADYKNKIAQNPNDYQAYNDLGYLSFILKVDPKYAEYYKKSIKIKPDYAQAHYNLALYYLFHKDKALALEECRILEKLSKDLAGTILRTIDLIEQEERR